MTLSAIDPKTALIVIDLQQGIVSLPLAHPVSGVVTHAGALLEAFRHRGLPVVLVNVAGMPPGRTNQARGVASFPPGWTELIPELNRQASDHLVTKHTQSAFRKTGLEEHLRALGVTQVVIAGIATGSGVASTAQQAFESGFNVTLAVDAMTDRTLESHDYHINNIFPRLGETGSTQEIIALLARTPR